MLLIIPELAWKIGNCHSLTYEQDIYLGFSNYHQIFPLCNGKHECV